MYIKVIYLNIGADWISSGRGWGWKFACKFTLKPFKDIFTDRSTVPRMQNMFFLVTISAIFRHNFSSDLFSNLKGGREDACLELPTLRPCIRNTSTSTNFVDKKFSIA
jgi:hypothetical protein